MANFSCYNGGNLGPTQNLPASFIHCWQVAFI
jgi:hypothetical protein